MAKDTWGKVLAADLVHHPDDDHAVVFDPTAAQLRWLHAELSVRQRANEFLVTLHRLDIPVTDEVLTKMMDAAEREHGRIPEVLEPRPMLAAGRHDPVVYYMRFDGNVKIGTSTDVVQRRGAVPGQGVMAVEWGDRTLEAERHQQFAMQHRHREWFRLDAVLAAHITEIRGRFEAAEGCTTEAWLHRVH